MEADRDTQTSEQLQIAPHPAADLLHGAEAIAEFLGVTTRRGYYLLERQKLPCFKLGSAWTARKSTLLAHLEKLEGGDRD